MEVSKGGEKGAEEKCNNETAPKLMSDSKPQIQEDQRAPRRKNAKKRERKGEKTGRGGRDEQKEKEKAAPGSS